MSAPATVADPFATAGETLFGKPSPADVPFGHILGNKRYKMPLLPGEVGPKSVPKDAQPWVSGGMLRVTRLSAAISDSRALGVWEMEQALVGLARDPALYEELCMTVQRGDREGVNWQRLDQYTDYRKALTGTWDDRDGALAGRAKMVAGANQARQAGVNRHEAWEERAKTGELVGTPGIQNQLLALELLLAGHGLERVPELSERVVRTAEVDCAGRFDDIVRSTTPCPTCGRDLCIADLKNKSRKFWTMQEVRAQLAVYARAEHMLAVAPDGDAEYVSGPAYHVCRCWGWILVMPADGADPYLHRANLEAGWRTALLARQVVDDRAQGRSVEAFREAEVKAGA